MSILHACIFAHYVSAWCPHRLKEVIASPRTNVTDDCELLRECWKLNLGRQEEQPVFFTELFELNLFIWCMCVCVCTHVTLCECLY